MTRSRKPRKAYRPQPVAVNAHQVAMARVHTLRADDVANQVRLLNEALADFARGHQCAHHWRSLADAANVAETLAGLGIGSGPTARQLIHDAQRTMSAVHARRNAGGSWTLHAGELEDLRWLIRLHHTQLAACDYSEFERALALTHTRIAQARAGNAPVGAVVIEGQIA